MAVAWRAWLVRWGLRWLVPPEVLAVLEGLRRAGHEAYLVGGCARDLLSGRRPADWDVATDAAPHEVLAVFGGPGQPGAGGGGGGGAERVPGGGVRGGTPGDGRGPRAVVWAGARYGTMLVRSGGLVVEVTSFREEAGYRDHRHPDQVHLTDSLRQDLARRDFTVNAIAFSTDGQLVDPWEGLRDLRLRTIRAVGDPVDRFEEDALRMLRAVRLAAQLDFDLHPSVLFAIQRKRRLLRAVSAERVRDELGRLLTSAAPVRGLELLRRTGLLAIVLPELQAETSTEHADPAGGTVWAHTLATVAAVPADPVLRWGALLHEAGGRPSGDEAPEAGGDGEAARSARVAGEVLARLRFDRSTARGVLELIRHQADLERPLGGDPALRRYIHQVGRETAGRLAVWVPLHHRVAGRPAHDPALRRARRIGWLLRRERAFDIRDLAVDGHAVMRATGLDSGPEVGAILRRLLEEVWEDPAANRPRHLLARARELARNLGPAPRHGAPPGRRSGAPAAAGEVDGQTPGSGREQGA